MAWENPHVDSPEGQQAQNDVWANGLSKGKPAPDEDTRSEDKATKDRRQRIQNEQQRQEDLQPVEQHSPTQVHVPAWKTIVLGGSGGVRVRA